MNNIKTFENFNKQDMFTYIENNDIKSVKNYINSGYDLNIKDEHGRIPLIYAVYANNVEIVQILLDSGVNIDMRDNHGCTALINAVINTSEIEIIKLLLNAGADIDKQDNNGYTALIYAAYDNNRNVIELLLDYHADEFILSVRDGSFYDYLNTENKKYFTQNYPTSVYNAILHNYKKSFTEFVKDFNVKIKNNK